MQANTYIDSLTGHTIKFHSQPPHASWKHAANAAIKAGAPIFIIKSRSLYVPWDGRMTAARA